jgi:hypothetical protein
VRGPCLPQRRAQPSAAAAGANRLEEVGVSNAELVADLVDFLHPRKREELPARDQLRCGALG